MPVKYLLDQLFSFQPLYVLFYLKQFFYLNLRVYHQNLSFLQNYHFVLAKFAFAGLKAKISDVNFLCSNIVITMIMISNFNFINLKLPVLVV